MLSTGHQQNNKHPTENRDLINMNHVTQPIEDLSVQHANVLALFYYLNELQKKNLVTPSIATPFPKAPINEEKLIIHKAYRKVQKSRMDILRRELLQFRSSKVPICFSTLKLKKMNLKKKILHLQQKFCPSSVNTTERRNKKESKNKKISNKKSRERYAARRFRHRLLSYLNNPECRSAINLSSVEISADELVALELGFGFVISPNNPAKEEEALLLEGFRFLDRLGKADAILAEERKDSSHIQCTDTYVEDNCKVDGSTNDIVRHQFVRNPLVPQRLLFSQPKEHQLLCNESKCVKSEFEDLNNNLINAVKTKTVRRKFNLPKRTRNALRHLKSMVREKVVDIRKVDKGQMILIVDYSQRKLIEENNINEIATLCEKQESNWEQNREFVEETFKSLYDLKFVTRDELAAVTGLLAGGKNGKLTNRDGSPKYTKVVSSKELFSKQMTPYVYPLLKAHKLPLNELLCISPIDVSIKVPSRLVVGMQMCQLTRTQIWLENLLKPLSIFYGSFEYTKDSCDYLSHIESVKQQAIIEEWDWKNFILFNIDVKALYPSVKFKFLCKALHDVFDTCTTWSEQSKNVLVDLIIYTLENQQISWNGNFYLLKQGIATGAKHAVPLANILLTFILKDALKFNESLKSSFDNEIKLWKRYIDDGTGIYEGTIEDFMHFYRLLQDSFKKFDLDITCDTDTHTVTDTGVIEKSNKFITFLDVEIYKGNGTIYSREHRKETASTSYLSAKSAHPRHTFAGIVKSQLFRLRRICSSDDDFQSSIMELEKRCLRSGYSRTMVQNILSTAPTLIRSLSHANNTNDNLSANEIILKNIRLVILAGTTYEEDFSKFAKRMNTMLKPCSLKIQIVKSTFPSLGRLLFNNNDNSNEHLVCSSKKCQLCANALQTSLDHVTSTTTNFSYPVDQNLSCTDGGIYVVKGECNSQYTGKTVNFSKRFVEHFSTSKQSAVYQHKKECHRCYITKDFKVTLVENCHNRGKFSLSEREYLWNTRIKGTINIQKTLKMN